ncbi:hypothetical protein TNCV_3182551 [Trichonephila clavipes]|uniref:Uncharacterized protein n=1 Tax=Trichonephila clavipes TaxID=2585209 RepID=A0A8X6SH83_TRICX|nr:hypothetical protein TNCV_3182551 [Trichonephila clavipes]
MRAFDFPIQKIYQSKRDRTGNLRLTMRVPYLVVTKTTYIRKYGQTVSLVLMPLSVSSNIRGRQSGGSWTTSGPRENFAGPQKNVE